MTCLKTGAAALALLCALAAPAAADCISGEKVTHFRSLKTMLMHRGYKPFFTSVLSGAHGTAHSPDSLSETLDDMIGEPAECVDMGTRRVTSDFATTLMGIVGRSGRVVYIHLAILKVQGRFNVVNLQLGSDLDEMLKYVPR